MLCGGFRERSKNHTSKQIDSENPLVMDISDIEASDNSNSEEELAGNFEDDESDFKDMDLIDFSDSWKDGRVTVCIQSNGQRNVKEKVRAYELQHVAHAEVSWPTTNQEERWKGKDLCANPNNVANLLKIQQILFSEYSVTLIICHKFTFTPLFVSLHI